MRIMVAQYFEVQKSEESTDDSKLAKKYKKESVEILSRLKDNSANVKISLNAVFKD